MKLVWAILLSVYVVVFCGSFVAGIAYAFGVIKLVWPVFVYFGCIAVALFFGVLSNIMCQHEECVEKEL